MAGDVPDAQYDFRATPETRSVAETLVHIAWLWTADRLIHEERHLESLDGFDFPALMATSATTERIPRSRADILELLRVEGDRAAGWVESLSDAFVSERVGLPGGGSVTRFEMILATKEHELQHRAQLSVLTRLLGIVPRFTGLA
jgi:uncharacterized damage-inducible protein DinB